MVLRMMPLEEWPEADRLAWDAALRPATLRSKGGGAAKWSAKTRRTVIKRYGQFLTWYADSYGTLAATDPFARVTTESVGAYVTELRARYGTGGDAVSTTVHSMLRDLREALRVMCPHTDLAYLTEIVNRLSIRAKPIRRKASRVVHSAELFEAGLAQMAEAESAVDISQTERAAKWRDGFIVAFLAYRPIRLANLCHTFLGTQVRVIGERVTFHYEPEELKWRTGPPLEFDLPAVLLDALRGYLRHCREHLRRGKRTDALWLSIRGTPMSEQALYQQVVTVTRRYLGVPINPHMFRDCAATSIALDDPERALYIARILGHSTLRTAQKHYIHGQTARDFRGHSRSIDRRRTEAKVRAKKVQIEA